MAPWRAVLAEVQRELSRLSQCVESQFVLPNDIVVSLPEEEFESSSPAFEQIIAEMGETLAAWATDKNFSWYSDAGPFLQVRLDESGETCVTCQFRPSDRWDPGQ